MEEKKRERDEWQLFHRRLKELMGGMSHRELAYIAGASESTVHHWLYSGRIPRERYVRLIEQHFGKPRGWLLGEDEEVKASKEAVNRKEKVEQIVKKQAIEVNRRRIPILDVEVGAGNGHYNGDEQVTEWFEFPEGMVPFRGDLSIVTVRGDSMEPTYRHGDLVIVQPESRVIDAVLVVAWDDALMVKRVLRTGGKTIRLISDNSAYDPVTIAMSEIRVVGRVVGLLRWNA